MATPTEHKLRSGADLVVARQPGTSFVAIHVSWAGGSRGETPANSGVTRLVARSLTAGCGARTSRQVRRRADALGGSIEGTSGRHTLALRSRWPRRHWREGLALVVDCVARPRFERAAHATQRRRLLTHLSRRDSNGTARAIRLMLRTLFAAQPEALDPAGEPAAVAAVRRREVVAHYRVHYPVSAAAVAVVGDVSAAEVTRRLNVALGARVARHQVDGPGTPARMVVPPTVPPSVPPTVPPPVPPAQPRAEVYAYRAGGNAEVVVGFPGGAFSSGDRHALEVLAVLLGGPAGLLTADARPTGGLVHPVRVRSVPGIARGYVAAHATCTPGGASAVVAAVRARLTRLASERVPLPVLARAKRRLLTIDAAARKGVQGKASALAFHRVHGLGIGAYAAYPRAIASVSADDVQRIARTYLDWSRAVVATVTTPSVTPGASRRVRGVRKRPPRARRRPKRTRR